MAARRAGAGKHIDVFHSQVTLCTIPKRAQLRGDTSDALAYSSIRSAWAVDTRWRTSSVSAIQTCG